MLRYLPFLLLLALWIYAFIDCLNTPEEEVRGLPKVVWVIIILLFGEVLVGPVAWLVAGKVGRGLTRGATPSEQHRDNQRTQYVAPDDNPEFLNSLKTDTASARNTKDTKDAKDAKDAKGIEDIEDVEDTKASTDEALLKDWEADLRRREDELRRREQRSTSEDES